MAWWTQRQCGWLLGAAAFGINVAAAYLNRFGDAGEVLMSRADVFIGWQFEATTTPVTVVPTDVLAATAVLWPTWGTVAVMPPPRTPDEREQDSVAGRASQWPFAFFVDGAASWQTAVTWLLGQAGAAVFIGGTPVKGSAFAFEYDLAIKTLGAERVSLLSRNIDGALRLVVCGSRIEPPAEFEDIYPSVRAISPGDYRVLAALRAWVASLVAVPAADYEERRARHNIARRISSIARYLLVVSVMLAIGGVVGVLMGW
jgi:hypothetical protein